MPNRRASNSGRRSPAKAAAKKADEAVARVARQVLTEERQAAAGGPLAGVAAFFRAIGQVFSAIFSAIFSQASASAAPASKSDDASTAHSKYLDPVETAHVESAAKAEVGIAPRESGADSPDTVRSYTPTSFGSEGDDDHSRSSDESDEGDTLHQ